MRERRSSGDVPLGEEVVTERAWRRTMRRCKDALLLFAVAGGIVSGVGFLMGPVFGKHIADASRDQINAQAVTLLHLDSVNLHQSDSIARLSSAVAEFGRLQSSSIYLQCETYYLVAPRGSIKPELCKDAKP